MAMFKAFKPEAMNKIANAMGYSGDMGQFQQYIEQDPMRQQQMQRYTNAAMQMAKGGVVKMQAGGDLQKQIEEAQKQVEASRNINYKGSNINIAGGPSMTDGKSGTSYQGFYDAGGRFRKFNQHPDVLAADKAYRSATANLTNLQKQYADMQKQAASQPQKPNFYLPPSSPQLVDPREAALTPTPPPQSNDLFNAAPAVVVYDPNTGQQYGSPQQAMQAGVSNPVMSLPPGVSPIPMRGGPKLTGAQPGGAMPVMDDPRGPIIGGRPSFVSGLAGLGGPADKAVPVPKLQDVNKMFDTSVVDPNTGFMQRLRSDGTVDTGNFGNYQYYADKAQKDYEKNMSEYERQRQALGDNFTYGQLQQFKQQEGIQNLKTQHANVDTGFFDSPEFKNIKGGPAGQAFTYSAYFGMHPNTSIGQRDQAYEAYLRRTNQTNKLKGGSEFIQADGNVSKLESDPTAQQDTPPAAPTPQSDVKNVAIGDVTTQRMYAPGLPQGGVTTAAMTPTGPGQEVQQGTGALTGAVAVPTAMAQTATATQQQESQANVMEAATAAPAVDAAMNATQAAQATVDPRAQVTAAQQTATSVGNLSAAQGNATLINNPVQRQIQAGELISGAADAQTAATFTEQVQAAEATPSTQATVQGQLASLTANFDAANPPAWAAGAMRNATQAMAARGLGASSLAGQAIVQATLEAALPIAQADAAVTAQFEAQNLSNRQQRAMLAAQQRATFMGQEFDQAFQSRVQNASRIADVANMNFTAEQQVQLENSRAANTMNLNNLSNSQAMTMAEASALAQMDASNLNNRQQAAVNNAQTFLQTDMANLSNQQQTELFKAQQRTQSMFTDQAATNAARQFNASSQNQVDQFFANLAQQTSQFNATQQNAQAQFNAGQANTVNRFNAEMNNQRDQFNAQNQIVIAQSNAQWRRQIATADTAAVNRANELNAAAILDVSKEAYDNLWNYYSDVMEWAWTTGENDKDRITQMALGELSAKTSADMAKLQLDAAESGAIGGFFSDILTSQAGSVAGKFFGL